MAELSVRGLEICQQVGAAFAKRGNLLEFWQELAEHFYPERADFTTKRTLGADFASQLYSSEPVLARRDFGNYLGSAIRPLGREWFTPRARDDEINQLSEVQTYLKQKGLSTLARLKDRRSQFVRAATAGDHDYVTFGNSVTSVEEWPDKTGLRYRTWHLRDCAWRDNYEGEVDTMFRRIPLSVRMLCSQERSRGWEVHPKMKERLNKSPDDPVEIHHVLMPWWDYDANFKTKNKNFDFVSVYIDMENKHIMSEKQMSTFVYAVSRWFTIDSSPYAFSPAAICAIPDARTLQVMTWSIMEAGEKAVEPPMAAVEEAVQGGVDLRAGAVTWIDKRYDERTGEAVRAIELGGSPQFGDVLREGITGNLQSAWYLNKLFLPQQGPQMTAEEIMRRHEEWLRVAQPIIEPAEPERNSKLLEVTISLEMQFGLWGDLTKMPAALRGRQVDFAYDNPLNDARKQSASNSYKAVTEIALRSVEAFGSPAVLKNLDQDKAFRDAVAGVAPPDWLLPKTEAEEAVETEDDIETAGGAAAEVAQVMPMLAQAQAAQAKAAA
jgi:hypothetical protein